MNSSQFMDKQILGLSGSQTSGGGGGGGGGGGDFFELMNPQEDHQQINGGEKKDEILPSYDFQQIRPSSVGGAGGAGGEIKTGNYLVLYDARDLGMRFWNSYGSPDHESAKVIQAKDKEAYDAATVAEIDQTMKKYSDSMLHALEGVSARLTQLESRTRHLEGSVDDLKLSVANDHGSTDGKLRQLENILREMKVGCTYIYHASVHPNSTPA
ncbi:hypothetical protein QJS04_geneDACA005089 [Acorus gramineus]|uniref:Uncharacterized protein n=1 Tax=Acorus gramineus TaxID=55184 RepID=A0AAV9AW55_ACOGR|nr:hypothetical protein QJS04_geneDACA005089 [Acorus gramineus]